VPGITSDGIERSGSSAAAFRLTGWQYLAGALPDKLCRCALRRPAVPHDRRRQPGTDGIHAGMSSDGMQIAPA